MTEMTVKELAARERVHEMTVYRWIAKGAVEVRRTPGGGIRIVDRRTMPRAGVVVITTGGQEKAIS